MAENVKNQRIDFRQIFFDGLKEDAKEREYLKNCKKYLVLEGNNGELLGFYPLETG